MIIRLLGFLVLGGVVLFLLNFCPDYLCIGCFLIGIGMVTMVCLKDLLKNF